MHSLVSLLAVGLFLVSPVQAIDIHVSSQGDDDNDGSENQALATPLAARNMVRTLISRGLNEEVQVILQPGTYHLAQTLEFRPEDSGTREFPITWKSASKGRAVLDGGIRLPAKWRKTRDGIWEIHLHSIGPESWNFRQLFIDGRQATRARFPNAHEKNPFLYTTGGGIDHARINPSLIRDDWGKAQDAQINIVPQWKFFNQWNTVTGVDKITGRIDFADSERHARITPGNWFWIEGVREELDQPDEWFFDPQTRILHYMPPPDVDPNELRITAPLLDRIINVRGDIHSGTHVSHLHFENLEFRHTSFTLGHIEARVHTDTAIFFENTLDCSVSKCHFENLGGYALWLHLDSRRNRFDRNIVRHSGGGGVLMTGSRFSYMDENKVYTPGEAAAKVAPILNEVTRNTIEHCGRIRYYGGGVHLDSRPFSMSMEPGNLISHNHFNDLSRNGIFAFRNQGGNVIEYNHIHNAMQTTIDGACIHFATMNHLNAPNHILNNWLYDVWGYEQRPDGRPQRKLGNGIFLDWDTSNTTVKNNWIYNSVGGAIKPIWENHNLVIENNRESDSRIVPPFVHEVGPDGTASHNIDLASNRLVGSVIHHGDTRRVSTRGRWQPETVTGMWGLFRFDHLVGTPDHPSEAIYQLPIQEDGLYQISLLYQPGKDRATQVPVRIVHAEGEDEIHWNMRLGSRHGFATTIGRWPFKAGKKAAVILSTSGCDGIVIADSVAFVKVGNPEAPHGK